MSDKHDVDTPQQPTDPFAPANLAAMRLTQDFASAVQVKPAITTVAVRKPSKHEFVRVRSGSDWRFETGCFVDKENRETYLVTPALWSSMPGDVVPTCLVLVIARSSPVPFMWGLTIPDSERPNRWHESAIEASRLAEKQWLRCVADMAAGQYVPYVATGNLAEPEWPEDLNLADYMRLAFRDRFVDSPDHLVLRKLRGEI